MTAETDAAGSRPRVSEGLEAGTTARLPRMRRIIASRMTESLRIAAQLTAVQEADVTAVAELRNRVKGSFLEVEGAPLSYLPFFIRALVEAGQEFPRFNASIDETGTQVTYHAGVHVGIAVDTPRGLVVPVLRDAQAMSIPEIARGVAALAGRVREGLAGPDELTGSTITLSNIAGAGTLTDTPIINYPEVAILGTGAVVRRPRVVAADDGTESILIRSVCSLPLTYDHRLIDGADAGRFLAAIRRRLEAADFTADLAAYGA
ncbi:2-oxo acid dehydrogenase subunit E2 [Arthrobacter sp. zg-Y1219]|uniref:2-oxo acid dehydrogenase subunit E2 n=1 Tax=Arthrobacter sp. zg-Y1219 TaxID=3049067 RepID=UPI0024C29E5B|nr:2-oxo acid dehydrogenase subunit E2 [Arthrobacter sp. zg-Y1219]MDK1361091.1 2-oxo acid dehydrogenase subunit E2 [Arthrobacter sp. zg-Y1219]